MDTKTGLFSADELSKLKGEKILEFINSESATYLKELCNISNQITERAYSLLGLIIVAYSLIAGINYFLSTAGVILLIMLTGFIISVLFIGIVIKPFPFSFPGMTPDQMKRHIQWNQSDLYIDALLLSIYTNRNKIDFIQKSNKKRACYYTVSLFVLFITCVISALLHILS
jgi:hypothetical protein